MIITFVGHSKMQTNDHLADRLEEAIRENLPMKDKFSFYCGGYGDFDNLCAKVCRDIAAERKNCEVLLITPYLTESQQKKLSEIQKTKLYDNILYPPIENVPPRFAILKRNEWMINEADFVIAFVSHTYGGAYKTLNFAKRKHKRILNLAEGQKAKDPVSV